MKLNELTLKELIKLKSDIEEEIEKRTKTKCEPYQLTLYYDKFRGSGKCWVAEVDRKTKKILRFVNTESNVKEETYKGYKVYLLNDGYYLSNEYKTRSSDERIYFEIVNGEYIAE